MRGAQYPEQVDISLMLARLLTRDLRQQPQRTELLAAIERNLQEAIATADDDLPAPALPWRVSIPNRVRVSPSKRARGAATRGLRRRWPL